MTPLLAWWGPSDSGQAGNDHTDWFGCSGLQYKFPVLWRSCTADPSTGSVIGIRGDRGFHHPVPQICGGQSPDPRNQKLQWGCVAAGHTNYDLLWDSPSHGCIQIIDRAMSAITKGELAKATMTWRQAHFGAVMYGSQQLPHTSSNTTGVEKGCNPFLPEGWPHGGKGILPRKSDAQSAPHRRLPSLCSAQ